MEFTACNTCKCRLALNYVRYRDTAGNAYCHVCYQRLLIWDVWGVVEIMLVWKNHIISTAPIVVGINEWLLDWRKKTKSGRLYIRIHIWLLYRYDCWCMDTMREDLLINMKKVWNYPTSMNEAMWYMLLSFFMMIWMWMFIRAWVGLTSVLYVDIHSIEYIMVVEHINGNVKCVVSIS